MPKEEAEHMHVGGVLGGDFHVERCRCGWEGPAAEFDAHVPEEDADGPGE